MGAEPGRPRLEGHPRGASCDQLRLAAHIGNRERRPARGAPFSLAAAAPEVDVPRACGRVVAVVVAASGRVVGDGSRLRQTGVLPMRC